MLSQVTMIESASEVAKIRIFHGVAGPTEHLRGAVDRGLQGCERVLGVRALVLTRSEPPGSANAAGAAQQGRRLAVQYVGAGVAADHHGRIGARQVGETRRPVGSRRAQAVVRHLLQGVVLCSTFGRLAAGTAGW